jgi:hypothetical protein
MLNVSAWQLYRMTKEHAYLWEPGQLRYDRSDCSIHGMILQALQNLGSESTNKTLSNGARNQTCNIDRPGGPVQAKKDELSGAACESAFRQTDPTDCRQNQRARPKSAGKDIIPWLPNVRLKLTDETRN